MGCFCHLAMTPLAARLAGLHVVVPLPAPGGSGANAALGLPGGPAPAPGMPGVALPAIPPPSIPLPAASGVALPAGGPMPHLGLDRVAALAAEKVTEAADWLAARGLPAPPWQPDPAWHKLQLPMPQMSPAALATISGLTHLRAQVLAQFGIDLLDPKQADAFRRIVATLNLRFAQLPAPPPDGGAWIHLATLSDAIDRLEQAIRDGLLAPVAALLAGYNEPGGLPMRDWGSLLRPLRALAPLVAAVRQLGIDPQQPPQLAEALRQLTRIKLPPLTASAQIQATIDALSATNRLQAGLGADPLALGLEQVRAQLRRRLATALRALEAALPGVTKQTPAQLLARLPRLAVTPTGLATPVAVQTAMQMDKLAPLAWKVPETLPLVRDGLTTCTLVSQMQQALGSNPVQPRPCGSQCDAAAVLRTLDTAAAA